MGRKKLRREYCIMVTIDGEDYYMSTQSNTLTYGMRLVKNPKSAYIIKTRKKLEEKINNIILNNRMYLMLKGEKFVTPDDYIDLTINLTKEKFEETKKAYKEAKKKQSGIDFLDDIPCPVTNKYKYSDKLAKFNVTQNDIKINFKNAISYYEKYRKSILKKDELNKKKYIPKKVKFSILDVSFNFRFSKLKQLMKKD